MKNALIRNAQLLWPGAMGNGRRVSIWVEQGRFKRIAIDQDLASPGAGVEVIDATNAVLAPAFADLFVQLTDPGYEWRADVQRIAAEARAGGFADILCQPNTHPALDKADLIRALRQRTEQLGVRFHFVGALSVDAAGKDMAELHDLFVAGVRAFGDGIHPVQDGGLLMRCLRYVQPFGGLVMQLPNERSIAGKGLANESPATTALGLRGIPALAEEMQVVRDLQILEYTGGRIHFSPITTRGALQQIRAAKARGLNVTATTAPQYLYFDDTALNGFEPVYKIIPPLRTTADVAACRQALQDGTLDGIASHHAPMSLEDKAVEFDHAENGMATLAAFFAMCNTALVRAGIIDLAKLVEQITVFPRKLLQLPQPTFAEEAPADAVLVWPNQRFELEKQLPFSGYSNYPTFAQPLYGTVQRLS